MEIDPVIRKQADSLKQRLRKLESLLSETGAALTDLAEAPTGAGLRNADRLRDQLDRSFGAYLDKNGVLLDAVREQLHKMEEARSKAAMATKRTKAARDESRIQELSEELTRDLRLQRVDAAIKELLDFLSDTDFFAANASTGRRRRLRALQNSIDKALAK